MKKKASSQTTWALLANNITQAKIEAHRLRHLRNRLVGITKGLDEEKVWGIAGDIILGSHDRLNALERSLDKLSYIISHTGKDDIRNRLSISDREELDVALTAAPPFDPVDVVKKASPINVAAAYISSKYETGDWGS